MVAPARPMSAVRDATGAGGVPARVVGALGREHQRRGVGVATRVVEACLVVAVAGPVPAQVAVATVGLEVEVGGEARVVGDLADQVGGEHHRVAEGVGAARVAAVAALPVAAVAGCERRVADVAQVVQVGVAGTGGLLVEEPQLVAGRPVGAELHRRPRLLRVGGQRW